MIWGSIPHNSTDSETVKLMPGLLGLGLRVYNPHPMAKLDSLQKSAVSTYSPAF